MTFNLEAWDRAGSLLLDYVVWVFSTTEEMNLGMDWSRPLDFHSTANEEDFERFGEERPDISVMRNLSEEMNQMLWFQDGNRLVGCVGLHRH